VSDINAKVVEIVVERLNVGADTVTAESSFINDLGADSLDIVELVMEFEEAFDMTIPPGSYSAAQLLAAIQAQSPAAPWANGLGSTASVVAGIGPSYRVGGNRCANIAEMDHHIDANFCCFQPAHLRAHTTARDG